MVVKRPPALDRIDIKILAALQRDGRQDHPETGGDRGAHGAAMP